GQTVHELIASCQDCRHRTENSVDCKREQNFEVANEFQFVRNLDAPSANRLVSCPTNNMAFVAIEMARWQGARSVRPHSFFVLAVLQTIRSRALCIRLDSTSMRNSFLLLAILKSSSGQRFELISHSRTGWE